MKRTIDLMISTFLLVLLSIIIIFTALLIKWKLGSPVIYTQQRIGHNEKPFTIYKFRTMTNETDDKGKLLSNEARMTKLGGWIRKLSLDEIPQLINVLKGDMSLVGPRPLLPIYLPYYTTEESRRHEVRPGITGLAQVEGRNYVNWENRFALDVYYVAHRSFWMDIQILVKTVVKVLKRADIEDFPGQSLQRLDVERRERPLEEENVCRESHI
ncbi:sugar transferase [Halobacillus faecis]